MDAAAAVGDTLDVVRETAVRRRVVALDGAPGGLDLSGCVVVPQVEGDLGTRLARAFADAMGTPDGDLPTLLIGILFGLAMDYQVFMVAGMREAYVHGSAPKLAVKQGFTAGSRVVVAAAIIMTSVFSGFILSPNNIIASIGFALGIGVLADAFLVRMTLVPAVMTLLGKACWFLPRWLDKALPHVEDDAIFEAILGLVMSGLAARAPSPCGCARHA